MADNTLQTGSGNVAADLLTYEGDADALVQVIRPVHVTGSEGSHAVKEFLLAEDAAHSSGDIGVMGLTVRQDTAAALGGTDADYQPLITDANGRLHVAPLVAGSAAIGKLAANDGVDIGDVDVTSISAGANLIADVGISGARTSGGTTLYKNIDVDESEDQVKGSAGQVFWIHAMNLTSETPLYLKFYDLLAASVTVGTTVPDLTFPVGVGGGFMLAIPNGIAFSTGITIAATTGVADNDSGAPDSANELVVNMGYA